MTDRVDRAVVYKCRICGTLTRNPYVFATTPEVVEILTALRFKGVYRDPIHLSDLHSTSLHFCADGSVGISDIQGMVIASLNS
jgi:hypothetical protein